ncbi:MAG: hypothetical protein HRT44_11205 [Bdellovibrionales bacterium]|nr:hypothetical protein [Bdellovibrionales bacterium]
MIKLLSYLLFPFLFCGLVNCTATQQRKRDPYGGLAIPMKKDESKKKEKSKETP